MKTYPYMLLIAVLSAVGVVLLATLACPVEIVTWLGCPRRVAWIMVYAVWIVCAGVAALLTTATLAFRAKPGEAFSVGRHFAAHFEDAAQPMLWGVLGVFYGVTLAHVFAVFKAHVALIAAAYLLSLAGVWYFAVGLWFTQRWLLLEAKGMEWTYAPNGGAELYRINYRRRNGDCLVNLTTRNELRRQDVENHKQKRRQVLALRAGAVGAVVVAVIAFAVQPLAGAGVAYALVPVALAKAAGTFIYSIAHNAGAQFIPFARCPPPEIPEDGAKTVQKEKAFGSPTIVSDAELVARMAGTYRS